MQFVQRYPRKTAVAAFTCALLASVLGLLFMPMLIVSSQQDAIVEIEDVTPGVVIIFGAGLRRDGEPSDVLRDRLTIGARLYEQGKATMILVSGDNRFPEYNEPQVMHDVLVRDFGIPEEKIEIDFAGRRTYDTCARARLLWSVDRAILVSQEFHLPRAIWTCEQLGIDSVGVSATLRPYVRDEYFLFRERLALIKAFVDIYMLEPSYLKGPAEQDLSS